MNIFRKYTRKSLQSNRSRTLVTIIGIALSMALLTAVIEGAYSGVRFMENAEIANNGRWEAYFSDMDDAKLEKLKADRDVKDIVNWNHIGCATTGNDKGSDRYLIINSVQDDFLDMVAVNLSRGRLPQNDSEIIVPHNLPHSQFHDFQVGDKYVLTVGRRVSASGEPLGVTGYVEDEKLADTVEKEYTIVGIYNRLSNGIVPYDYPGYVAITKSAEGSVFGSFITLRNPAKAYDFHDAKGSTSESPEFISHCNLHIDLLSFKGTVSEGGIQKVIYGFAVILVILVAFGSISLIYNSFSISLAERTKQFGILKSVGATKKQLRSSVIYEALVLGAIGIPAGLIIGCAGIGITLYTLRDSFSSFTGTTGVQMRLVLNPVALIIAALVCLAVILISAWIPAARAVRIQPIEAVRQNADTKIKAREVKTSALTQKLFGFEGTMASKNFKRNAKRYRTTIVSLFMSVVLFIAASSFCSFLTGSVDGIVSNGTKADIVYTNGRPGSDPEVFSELLSGIAGVDKACYSAQLSGSTKVDPNTLSKRFWEIQPDEITPQTADPARLVYVQTAFVDDQTFRELLKENGLDEREYFDASSPKGVLYNHIVETRGNKGEMKWYSYELFDTSKLPFSIDLWNSKDIDGYVYYTVTEENGRKMAAYFEEEYLYAFYRSGGEDPDMSKAMLIPYDESIYSTKMDVSGVVNSAVLMISDQNPAVIYPYSMMKSVFTDSEAFAAADNGYIFAIMARDHAGVYKNIKQASEKDISIVSGYLRDIAESRNRDRMVIGIVNVFAYGFIILISLIALANVFNTISTSILLRRREFAMLKSIGLSERGFSKMMNYECIIYGARSLLFGLPVAVLVTYAIWRVTSNAFETNFYLPWRGVVIAVASVFIVVFATMLYSTRRIRRDNPIDALKNENL